MPRARNGGNQFQTLPQKATGPINFYGKDDKVQTSIQFVEHSQRVGGGDTDVGASKAHSGTILSGST
jgi:hypothetical protein